MEAPLCFKCNKPGHIKRDCPLLKLKTFKKDKKQNKKKALQATWDESDSSSDEEESSEGENDGEENFNYFNTCMCPSLTCRC